MSDFLSRLFLRPPGAGSDFFEDYFYSTIGILLLCAFALFILTLLLLLFGSHGSRDTRKHLDTDTRVKLCLGWAALLIFALLGGGVFWIRERALIPEQPTILLEFQSFACHITAMLLMGVVWIIFYWRVDRDVHRASRALQ